MSQLASDDNSPTEPTSRSSDEASSQQTFGLDQPRDSSGSRMVSSSGEESIDPTQCIESHRPAHLPPELWNMIFGLVMGELRDTCIVSRLGEARDSLKAVLACRTLSSQLRDIIDTQIVTWKRFEVFYMSGHQPKPPPPLIIEASPLARGIVSKATSLFIDLGGEIMTDQFPETSMPQITSISIRCATSFKAYKGLEPLHDLFSKATNATKVWIDSTLTEEDTFGGNFNFAEYYLNGALAKLPELQHITRDTSSNEEDQILIPTHGLSTRTLQTYTLNFRSIHNPSVPLMAFEQQLELIKDPRESFTFRIKVAPGIAHRDPNERVKARARSTATSIFGAGTEFHSLMRSFGEWTEDSWIHKVFPEAGQPSTNLTDGDLASS